MRRRLVPAIVIFVALMLDTTLLPMHIHTPWLVPLSLPLIICLGASQGRFIGMVYGLAAGLLIDILTGYPLGLRTFMYLGTGFLSGLILYTQDIDPRRLHPLRLSLFALGDQLVMEIIILVYQYFNTARFESIYTVNALMRVAITILLTVALYIPFARASLGRTLPTPGTSRRTREARHF